MATTRSHYNFLLPKHPRSWREVMPVDVTVGGLYWCPNTMKAFLVLDIQRSYYQDYLTGYVLSFDVANPNNSRPTLQQCDWEFHRTIGWESLETVAR